MGSLKKDFEKATGVSSPALGALAQVIHILDRLPESQQREISKYLAEKTGVIPSFNDDSYETNWDDPESYDFGAKRPKKSSPMDDMRDVL